MKKTIFAAVAAVGMLASAASAATLSGMFWDDTTGSLNTIDDAIAFANSNTADATFTSTGIAYGDGLLSGGTAVGSGLTNWSIGTLGEFLNADAPTPASSANLDFQESVIKLTGFVSLKNGDSLSVTSDDGFRLIIDGNTFSEFTGIRAPNNTTSSSWGGADGTFSATLWYFEGQRTQAQLVSNLGDFVAPVPVPASALLLLTAVGGIGFMRRRRKA